MKDLVSADVIMIDIVEGVGRIDTDAGLLATLNFPRPIHQYLK